MCNILNFIMLMFFISNGTTNVLLGYSTKVFEIATLFIPGNTGKFAYTNINSPYDIKDQEAIV